PVGGYPAFLSSSPFNTATMVRPTRIGGMPTTAASREPGEELHRLPIPPPGETSDQRGHGMPGVIHSREVVSNQAQWALECRSCLGKGSLDRVKRMPGKVLRKFADQFRLDGIMEVAAHFSERA